VFYRPGIQAWYNNFILTEPGHPDHVWVGLEEVYESTNGGSGWTTPGKYWNFGLRCWAISNADNTCPETTHPDQHSIVVYGGRVYVGNDGGVKSRPVNGTLNDAGHATDWANHRTACARCVLLGGRRCGSGAWRFCGGRWPAVQRRLPRAATKDNEGNTEISRRSRRRR
jgi:hypothetical protein